MQNVVVVDIVYFYAVVVVAGLDYLVSGGIHLHVAVIAFVIETYYRVTLHYPVLVDREGGVLPVEYV